MTRGLGFSGLIRRTAPFSRLYDTLGDVEDLFYPESSQVPYQSPFTTHKGMWRTYSNPDPHGEKKSKYPVLGTRADLEGGRSPLEFVEFQKNNVN